MQIVNQFVRSLTDAGYRVWIDRDGISSGDRFTKIIPKAIKSSAIVIFFSSANSNSSKWTVMEIGYALKKEKTIIPIRLDETEYEDSIDFLLTLIDFIPYNPQQPSASIDRLITSLAAHGCERRGSEATTSTHTQPGMSPEELFLLGEVHYDNEEYEQAVKYYYKAAKQGHTDAQCRLGSCYYYGIGIPQDYQQAFYWYRKAADQGYAPGLYYLGFCYTHDDLIHLDDQQVLKWYREAAEQGYAPAQSSLGKHYLNGWGAQQDYYEAVKWYRKAAEQGYAPAQYDLGYCYENGRGVLPNREEALRWYRKAAEQGHQNAIKHLKWMGVTV